MKLTFAHLCLFLLGIFVLCIPVQAAFYPGYVITIDGDSINGEVDIDAPQDMKHLCRFVPEGSKKTIKYTPEKLIRFGTSDGNRQFISGTVPYFFKKKRIFLEVLQQGRLNLYYTFDGVLNDRYYVNKKEGELIDVMYDWDENMVFPLKSDYIAFLKKAMVDAPELMLDIERMKNPSPSLVSELVGKYNRKFDRSAGRTTVAFLSPVAKTDKQIGLSVTPGIMIPDLLYVDNQLTDVYCGLSLTKRPLGKRNGFHLSLGAYVPGFSLTTNGRWDVSTSINSVNFKYMVLIPANLSYRFTKNDLQPAVGLDFHTFLNDYETWFTMGPSVGLYYTPVNWLSVSCSFQFIKAQVYTKAIRYNTATPLSFSTGLSINF